MVQTQLTPEVINMKKLLVLLIILFLTAPAFATDFTDADQLYGWNGSAQFWQTWSDHKTQLSLLYQGKDTDLTTIAGLSCSADQVMAWNGSTWACADQSGGGATTWLGLSDTPSSFTADYYVKVNSAGNALELVAAATGTGDLLSTNNLSDLDNVATARTNLGVDVAGTDNSTPVTIATGVSALSITGQEIDVNSNVDAFANLIGTANNIIGWDSSGNLENKSTIAVDVVLADEPPSEGTGHITYRSSDDALLVYDGANVDSYSPDNTIAAQVTIDASGFNGNLSTTDDTIQEVAQAVDDLSTGGTTQISGTVSLGISAIASEACATVVSATATGAATTDVIMWSFNADPTGTTGYEALTTGMLTIIDYPTTDTVNFKVCNMTGASITPGAVTLNWRIVK